MSGDMFTGHEMWESFLKPRRRANPPLLLRKSDIPLIRAWADEDKPIRGIEAKAVVMDDFVGSRPAPTSHFAMWLRSMGGGSAPLSTREDSLEVIDSLVGHTQDSPRPLGFSISKGPQA